MKIPTTLDMMRQLIAIPSVSSVNREFDQSNRAIIDLLANWCSGLGLRCTVTPIPDHPDKYNLLAVSGGSGDGLLLAGHSDTVPYDINSWRYDPFTLTEDNNRLYGLGTCDMKVFFALVLTAYQQILRQNITLKHPFTFLATANEESNMAGVKALTEKPRAGCAIIGEPTGLVPVRMHKGIFMEAIRLHGQSGHSSDPDFGKSALDGMSLVMMDLLQWRKELQEQYHNSDFLVPVPTLNFGHIRGGDSANRICGECEMHMDFRPLPGMNIDILRGELRRRVREVLLDSGLRVEFISLFDGIPPLETKVDSDLVILAEKLTGRGAGAVSYGTEAPFLQELGMETIILGPGDIDQAHQPDEFIGFDRLQPMMDIIGKFIAHYCL